MTFTERELVETVGAITLRQLRLWVRRGWVVPAQGENGPVFDEADVARARLVWQLRCDMNVNDDAVPVVLALIDQLHGIRQELKAVLGAIGDQPGDIRQRIRSAYRTRRSAPE
jgi:chaperone modulatory protein CbpM